MKKFNRVIGKICGICLILGIALTIAGGVMGGAYILSDDLNAGRFSFHWDGDFFKNGADTKNMNNFSEEQRFSIEEVSSLELNGKYGAFEVETWEKDYFAITGVGETSRLYYSLQEGVLKVATGSAKNWFQRGNGVEAKIYIPQDVTLSQITLKVGAGSLHCSDLKTKVLDVNIGAGEATFETMVAQTAKIEVGAGEGNFTRTQMDDCDIKVGMGEIDVEGSIGGNANIDCGMGEVDLALAATPKEFNYSVKVGAGDVKIGEQEYAGLSHKAEVDNGANKKISIDCGMGEVTVRFPQ